MARDPNASVIEDEKKDIPAEPARPPPGDARHDKEQQKRNRENLGVDEQHKTPEMEKGHRGTFP